MAHSQTARQPPNTDRFAVGDDPIPRKAFDEAKSFALGAYEPSEIQADWADFQLYRSLPEDVENG